MLIIQFSENLISRVFLTIGFTSFSQTENSKTNSSKKKRHFLFIVRP